MHTAHPRSRIALVLVCLFLGAACQEGESTTGGPIDASNNALKTAGYAKDLVKQLGGGVDFVMAHNSVMSKMLGGSAAAPRVGTKAIANPFPDPLHRLLEESPGFKRMRPSPFLRFATVEEDFDETSRDVEVLLRDRLLAETNIESQTATQITYRLRPDPTCRQLPSQAIPGTSPALDEGCVSDLMKLEIRIVATQDGDGGRFQILLGPDRHELSVVIIHSQEIAWEVGLASAKKATDYINQALGKAEPVVSFTRLEGRLGASLEKLGEKHIAFTASILETLDIDSSDSDAAVRIAKSMPLFRVTADGVSEQATLKLAIGQMDIKTTWDPQSTGAKNRDLHVAIGGLYGQTTLVEAAKEVSLVGLGVGATAVMVRGTKIFGLDFNAGDDRKMDVTAKLVSGDVTRLEVKPKFDLSLLFNFMAVASDFSEPPEPALADETYSIRLAGASPAAIEISDDNATTGSMGAFKVVAGSLVLSAKTAPAATVTVPAGQCLLEQDPAPTGAHPILGNLKSGPCP